MTPVAPVRYVIRYDDGMYDEEIGWPVDLPQATVYDTRAEAERAAEKIGDGEVVEYPVASPKTPEQLNAEFVRVAADLGDGLAEAVASAVAAAVAQAVAEERAAVVRWLRYAGDGYADAADCIKRGEHREEA